MSARPTLRRLILGLPVLLVASALPVAPLRERPQINKWTLDLEGSGPLAAPDDFAMLGVSWPSSSIEVQAVQARTSTDGVRWSEWRDLDIDPEQGPDAGREGGSVRATQPMWVDRARFVDVRFSRGRPPDAAVHLIDPGPDPRPAVSQAFAAPSRPGIISRAQWGADESIRRGTPQYASNLKLAIVHHTATTNAYPIQDSARIVRSIYAYHVQTNRWNDIGYNLLVDRYGQIFEGRAGGVDRAVIGAHAAGFNTGSTGIAVIGTFIQENLPGAGVDALQRLLAWKLDVHHVDPRGSVRVTSGGSSRYPAGTSVNLRTIAGHRDVGQTECPGDRLFSQLPSIRDAARSIGLPKIYNPAFNRSAFSPNGDGRTDDVTFSARIDPASAWAVDVTDPLGRRVHRQTGSGSTATVTWDGRDGSGGVPGHGYYTFETRARSAAGVSARPAQSRALLAAWPQGSLLKGSGAAVYRMRDGKLEHFGSRPELLSHYRWEEIARVPDSAIDAFPRGRAPGFRNGSLLRTPDRKVWLVSDGSRRHIRSGSDLDSLGLKRENVVDVSQSQANVNPQGAAVNAQSSTFPNGMVVRGSATGPVYWIVSGARRHVPSRNVLTTWFRPEEIARVNDARVALHSVGAPLGFRDGTLVRGTDSPKVWVIAGGQRRHIRSGAVLDALGFRRENIRTASAAELALHPEGSPV